MKISLYPKNKLALIAFLLTYGMFFGVHKEVFSETMSGGAYTLNGSTNTILNQGEGGVYTLSPNGDSMSGQNSSGGAYTLYATPYIGPVPAASTAVSEVIGLAVYGSAVQNDAIGNTNTPGKGVQDGDFVFDPKNPDRTQTGILPGTQNDSEYSEYFEGGAGYIYKDNPDTVNFGRGTSTSENTTGENVLGFPFFWFIVLIILFVFWKSKRQNQSVVPAVSKQ